MESAAQPTDIPARGWLDVVKRTQKEIKTDNVTLIAAGVAFYSMLAIFPELIAVVSIYGLVANPADVARQVDSFAKSLPPGAGDLLTNQLQKLVSTSRGSLSVALVISIAGALWSASAGVQAMMKGLNVVYDEEETRGFVKLRGLALLLTFGAIVVVLGALGLVAVLPGVLNKIGLGRAGRGGAVGGDLDRVLLVRQQFRQVQPDVRLTWRGDRPAAVAVALRGGCHHRRRAGCRDRAGGGQADHRPAAAGRRATPRWRTRSRSPHVGSGRPLFRSHAVAAGFGALVGTVAVGRLADDGVVLDRGAGVRGHRPARIRSSARIPSR